MMEAIVELISSLGFPIACVIGLAWFAYYMVKRTDENNAKVMAQIQDDCKAREDKLYIELAEGRKINGRFAEIIGKYDIRLETIQRDIEDIKDKIS